MLAKKSRVDKVRKIFGMLKDLFGLINIIVFLVPGILSVGVLIGSNIAGLVWLTLLAACVAVIFLSMFMVVTVIRQRKIIVSLRERQETMEKQMEHLFGVSCQSCGEWIDTEFPNYAMSGMHFVDGKPTGSFWRNTEERVVVCKKCGKRFHIDVPRSQTFKIKKT